MEVVEGQSVRAFARDERDELIHTFLHAHLEIFRNFGVF